MPRCAARPSLSLPPAVSTMLVARENAIGAKVQSRLAGVTALEYWGSHAAWDALPSLAIAAVLAGGLAADPSWVIPFPWTFLLLALHGFAATLLGYCFTFAVTSPAGALAATAGYQFLLTVGVLTGVVTQLDSPATVSAITYAGVAACPLSSVFFMGMYGLNVALVDCDAAPTLAPTAAGLLSWVLLGRPLAILAAQVGALWLVLMVRRAASTVMRPSHGACPAARRPSRTARASSCGCGRAQLRPGPRSRAALAPSAP